MQIQLVDVHIKHQNKEKCDLCDFNRCVVLGVKLKLFRNCCFFGIFTHISL